MRGFQIGFLSLSFFFFLFPSFFPSFPFPFLPPSLLPFLSHCACLMCFGLLGSELAEEVAQLAAELEEAVGVLAIRR